MELIVAPDVLVNASVALGSPPEQVARRVLGAKQRSKTSAWILTRVEAMFRAIPSFKPDAVAGQMTLIRDLLQEVDVDGDFGADAWQAALTAAAKAAGVSRVVTDHPDLLQLERVDGVEFVSSEAWLLEYMTPPPAPGAH